MNKFNAEQAREELAARIARRAATQAQISVDQTSGDKRDARALRAEAAWIAKQAK